MDTVNPNTLRSRIHRGWDPASAAALPDQRTTHGQSPRGSVAPIYRRWCGMRSRVANSPLYANVQIDARWATFEGFLAHPPAGEYAPGKVLARTGDTGDYSPENCRWATKAENGRESNERRALRTSDGRMAVDVARANGVRSTVMHGRLQRGWDIDRAVAP